MVIVLINKFSKNSLLRCCECKCSIHDIGLLVDIDECKVCIDCYVKNGGSLVWLNDMIKRKEEFILPVIE